MAQKLTITIPDELHERLEKVRDGFNISRACQEAIETEIGIQETKASGKGKSMKEVIEKLRMQKSQHGKQYFDQGRKDAVQEAKDLDYDEFIEIKNIKEKLDLAELQCVLGGNSIIDLIDSSSNNWSVTLQDYLREQISEDDAFDSEQYARGWVEGVLEFFDEVKDQL